MAVLASRARKTSIRARLAEHVTALAYSKQAALWLGMIVGWSVYQWPIPAHEESKRPKTATYQSISMFAARRCVPSSIATCSLRKQFWDVPDVPCLVFRA